MRDNFSFQNPTRIRFGKHALSYLEEELSAFGERILLVYGSGSVKRTGVYDQVMKELDRNGKKVRELSGVPSNPTAAKVYEGSQGAVDAALQQHPGSGLHGVDGLLVLTHPLLLRADE